MIEFMQNGDTIFVRIANRIAGLIKFREGKGYAYYSLRLTQGKVEEPTEFFETAEEIMNRFKESL
jgi:hypothetical protein